MKAICVENFGEPAVMRIKDLPSPQPDTEQILVRVHAAGVNPVDTYIRSGNYARKPALPYTPGMDGAGVVEIAGANVKGIKPGDRVYFTSSDTGSYAEYALCKKAYPLPENISFAQGAALGSYFTAYHSLFQRGNAKAGETVLIHGATGGVGLACVQLAKSQGLTVFGTGSTREGLKLVKEQGADAIFDHKSKDYLEEILKATGGKGVNIIAEMLANINLAHDLTLLANRGRVLVIGNRGSIEINPREIMARSADIRGIMLFNMSDAEREEATRAIESGLRNSALHPVIRSELPLADAPAAHLKVLETGAHGKIVLIP